LVGWLRVKSLALIAISPVPAYCLEVIDDLDWIRGPLESSGDPACAKIVFIAAATIIVVSKDKWIVLAILLAIGGLK
jgi:hypothetical protein